MDFAPLDRVTDPIAQQLPLLMPALQRTLGSKSQRIRLESLRLLTTLIRLLRGRLDIYVPTILQSAQRNIL